MIDSPQISMLPESLQFLRLIWAFQLGLERKSEEMLANIGVTGRQRFVLRVVGLIPDLTVDQLSAMFRVERSALEADIEHLLTRGMIATEVRVANGPPLLHLTPSAATINATWTGTIESVVSRALDEATPYERAAFRRMLERVTPYLLP